LPKGTFGCSLRRWTQIAAGTMPKGDVLAVARLAGIMAAKRTHELVPLCHPLPITSVRWSSTPSDPACDIRSRVIVDGKTGVEMEALTAVSVAALTLYDMCKAVDRGHDDRRRRARGEARRPQRRVGAAARDRRR
jgi:cyclic pyranopterin phosphate synthase